ncbi:MAG: hypothetical protein KME31_26870 [Tolypothrix carrinoi HA7290-LM1]|nr:hypothetical protein [Tolypothrix carrinoi HA7290-LM1]
MDKGTRRTRGTRGASALRGFPALKHLAWTRGQGDKETRRIILLSPHLPISPSPHLPLSPVPHSP